MKSLKVNVNKLAVGVLGMILIVLAVSSIRGAKSTGQSPNKIMPALFITGWLLIILALNLDDKGTCIVPNYDTLLKTVPAIVIVVGALMGGSGKPAAEKYGGMIFMLGWVLLVLSLSYRSGWSNTIIAVSTVSAVSIAGGMMLIRTGDTPAKTTAGWAMFGAGWTGMAVSIASV